MRERVYHQLSCLNPERSRKMGQFPYSAQLEANKKYCWCTCELTSTEPFCDGTHKTSESGKRSLHFEVAEAQEALLCGCKLTKNPPYCDGSHNCE